RHLFDYNMDEEKLKKLTISKFHDWGAKMVVFTAGGRYIEISPGRQKKNIFISGMARTEVTDFAGGDPAFISGFLVAYLEKLPLKKCALVGHEVARAALKSVGPFPKTLFRKDIFKKIG
ncbi:MAG: PfkB family carbohydrate kinase, partial [Elusimicrobiota bacterium]|nr:PfkB family carbohydrate kinase [Elusimicrobiota bacterium]